MILFAVAVFKILHVLENARIKDQRNINGKKRVRKHNARSTEMFHM
jgi:hypothetical protein